MSGNGHAEPAARSGPLIEPITDDGPRAFVAVNGGRGLAVLGGNRLTRRRRAGLAGERTPGALRHSPGQTLGWRFFRSRPIRWLPRLEPECGPDIH